LSWHGYEIFSNGLKAEVRAGSPPGARRVVDSYYQMFIDASVVRDIWQATQADRALQKRSTRHRRGAVYPATLTAALTGLSGSSDLKLHPKPVRSTLQSLDRA
jgi:hypothetical protein